MPSLLSLADPRLAAAAIARDPQILWPVAALFATCVLLGITDTLQHRLPGRRSYKQKAVEQPVAYFLSIMSPILPGVLTVWLWATFFSLLILRLLHHDVGFDLLACLHAYALAPLLLARLAAPLRHLSRAWYWSWQVVAVGMLLWFVADLWICLAVGCRLTCWHAGLAAAPTVLCLVVTGVLLARALPDTYRAAARWHRGATGHIIVYSDLNLGSSLLTQMANLCDESLQSVIKTLEVEPPPYPIEVFLYTSETLRKRMAGNTGRFAWASSDSIHLPYDSWTRMRGTVAHELTHVMRFSRITRNPIALLEEGLATYVEAELVRDATHPPCITVTNSLHVLANQAVFYEPFNAKMPESTWSEMYAHAHALTRYLVGAYGLPAYRELCRQAGSEKGTDPERLAAAVQSVYHLSLVELERSWRRECDIVSVGPRMAWPWIDRVAAGSIRAARAAAIRAGATVVSTDRLLAQLLDHERYGACRVLSQAGIDIHQLRRELTAARGVERGQQGQDGEETPFSVPAKHAIDQAVKEAIRRNATFVGTEHLLLGCLLVGEGNAWERLTAAGLTVTTAREALAEIQRQIAAQTQASDGKAQNVARPPQ